MLSLSIGWIYVSGELVVHMHYVDTDDTTIYRSKQSCMGKSLQQVLFWSRVGEEHDGRLAIGPGKDKSKCMTDRA